MRNLRSKKSWRRIRPQFVGHHSDGVDLDEHLSFDRVTQSDFLREYFPSGHKIHDPLHHPDIYRVVEETEVGEDGKERLVKRYYNERVPRYAFAFQQIIAVKHLAHLCGNDVQFDLLNSEGAEHAEVLGKFRDGWSSKDMETCFYELARSVKLTGDGAVVGYVKDGVFSWSSFSFLFGDRLYAHYNHFGGLSVFARAFMSEEDVDDDCRLVGHIEVWDANRYYLLVESDGASRVTIGDCYVDGYSVIVEEPHGFPFIPVVYHRDEAGACWTNSQEAIDMYEISFSQMAQNNKAFGEPVLYFKGDDVDCVPDLSGTIKTVTMGKDDDAGYLPAQSASESYHKQLELTYRMIYEQSFAVIPPELKSGDLPAAALKILYSPAYEKALMDCADFQRAINELVRIFSFGFGLECEMTTAMMDLPLRCWLKPYVHVNWSSMVSDIVQCVNSGILSRQTGSERLSEYNTPKEWLRIVEERKELSVERGELGVEN